MKGVAALQWRRGKGQSFILLGHSNALTALSGFFCAARHLAPLLRVLGAPAPVCLVALTPLYPVEQNTAAWHALRSSPRPRCCALAARGRAAARSPSALWVEMPPPLTFCTAICHTFRQILSRELRGAQDSCVLGNATQMVRDPPLAHSSSIFSLPAGAA